MDIFCCSAVLDTDSHIDTAGHIVGEGGEGREGEGNERGGGGGRGGKRREGK